MSNSREPARSRQAKSGRTGQKPDVKIVQYSLPLPPRMIPGGVYSEQDLVHNLGCRSDLFREMRRRKKNPLKPLPTGTREFFYVYEQVIECWLTMTKED